MCLKEVKSVEEKSVVHEEELGKLIDRVMNVLKVIRVGAVLEEYKIQEEIANLLEKAGIKFQKECRLAPGNRIDFLVDGGIGIEVKKGKPSRTRVYEQLLRYTSFDDIRAVILAVERNVNIPNTINGRKCVLLGLNRLWGVALK